MSIKQKALAQDGNCTPPKHFEETITNSFYSQCSQQLILATVNFKTTLQQCTNSDGSVTFRYHVELHGTGQGYNPLTGQPTGTQYILNDNRREYAIRQPFNGTCTPSSDTIQYHESLISQGSAPNEQIVVTQTLSVDSSCQFQITGSVDTDCHG